MEVRSFKVRAAAHHVRAVVVDTDGERGRDLDGDAAQAVIDAAAPLFAALAAKLGATPQSISYNGDDDVLRVAPPTDADVDPSRLTLRGDALAPHVTTLRTIARAIRSELRKLSGDAPAGADASDDAPRDPNDPEFWDSMYRRGFTGWELGRPAPPLANYFAADPPQGKRALVVGCGRGNEARMLAGHGAQVTAIDISATAITQAAALPSPRPVDFRVENVFELRGKPPAYDLIVEHTCFCAIDPARRDDFVDAVRDALVPGGALVGLFFAHGRDGGPPFSVTADEVRARFADGFTIDRLERAADSVISRRGEELFARIVRD